MKNKWFVITFKNKKTVLVAAFNKEEATILAQAVMIKQGYTYDVEEIEDVEFRYHIPETDYLA